MEEKNSASDGYLIWSYISAIVTIGKNINRK